MEHTTNTCSPVALKPLTLKLKGIIDAAVMGGTAMYERAFFSEDFRGNHPEQRENLVVLENLMAEQIPLLGKKSFPLKEKKIGRTTPIVAFALPSLLANFSLIFQMKQYVEFERII